MRSAESSEDPNHKNIFVMNLPKGLPGRLAYIF